MTDKKRRLDKLGAGTPDPEVAKLSDAALLREYVRAKMAPEPESEPRDPLLGYIRDLTDAALLAAYEAVRTELVEQLRAKTDAELGAMLRAERGEGQIAALIEAEREARRPKPAPVEPTLVAVPPTVEQIAIEPHAVALEPTPPPTPPADGMTERQRKENAEMVELCRAVKASAEARAQREHADEVRHRHDPMSSEPVWHTHGPGG